MYDKSSALRNTIKTLKELKNRQEEGDGGAEDKMIVNI